jgi:hypothetical protein
MAVEFHDYSVEVKGTMDDSVNAVLAECAGEIISQTKRNSRVDTGKTKNSFTYKVVESEHTAYMGSPDENAIWEEFGTGEYALQGKGRKGGWAYKDVHGDWHYTNGKKPSRAFWKAYTSLRGMVMKRIQNSLKGL